MVKGIGVDIIEISRIKEAAKKYGQSFLSRVFTAREIEYCRSHKALKFPELAVRFAAKEAYSKALGTGIGGMGKEKDGVGWKDIEVVNDQRGKPQLYLKGKLNKKALVTLSHSRDQAIAFVTLVS